MQCAQVPHLCVTSKGTVKLSFQLKYSKRSRQLFTSLVPKQEVIDFVVSLNILPNSLRAPNKLNSPFPNTFSGLRPRV
jgi:hypothetical protein